jgi:hypothetical protein
MSRESYQSGKALSNLYKNSKWCTESAIGRSFYAAFVQAGKRFLRCGPRPLLCFFQQGDQVVVEEPLWISGRIEYVCGYTRIPAESDFNRKS